MDVSELLYNKYYYHLWYLQVKEISVYLCESECCIYICLFAHVDSYIIPFCTMCVPVCKCERMYVILSSLIKYSHNQESHEEQNY